MWSKATQFSLASSFRQPKSKTASFSFAPPRHVGFSAKPKRNFASSQSGDVNWQSSIDQLMKLPKFMQLRKTLEADVRDRMSLDEYKTVAKDHSLSETEAAKYIEALNATGLALHLPQAPHTVFLKPKKLIDSVQKLVDPSGEFNRALIEPKKEELRKVSAEFNQMNNLSALVERKVRAHMRRLAWISAAYLTVQGALVARLTWWEFSWDIMEPITYMITFATVAIGAYYFAFTLNDYSYESLSTKLQRRKREKLYRKKGFDANRYEVLKKKIANLKEELLALGVPAAEVEKTLTEAPAAPAPAK